MMLLIVLIFIPIIPVLSNDPPKLFPPPSNKIYHKVGSEALMTCGLKKGSLPLIFKWYKNGQTVQSSDSVYIGTNDLASNLVIKSLTMPDAGDYTCKVSNGFGSDSIEIKVIVEGSPQWSLKPKDAVFGSLDQPTLRCVPTGYPEPLVKWKKQIGPEWIDLSATKTTFQKTSAFEIKSTGLTKTDEGLYGCEASNGIQPNLWAEFRVKLSAVVASRCLLNFLMHLQELSCAKFFDGLQYRYQHHSRENNWPMKFTAYLPPKSLTGEKCPALIWLTGKTLGEFGFTNKSGFQRFASKYGMIVFAPEPTPRGIEKPLPDGSLEYGAQVGQYLDATTPRWKEHYRMYSYVTKEFYNLVVDNFPVLPNQICLSGHSMGGTASIYMGLNHPELFASVTSMSGNYNLTNTEDGRKIFQLYLGSNEEAWKAYDPTEVIKRYSGCPRTLLIDMGGGDTVYKSTDQTALLDACYNKNISLTFRIHTGYHHAYEFIQTFVEDHFQFHLSQLNRINKTYS